MPKCAKCYFWLPPEFLTDVSPTDKICVFCEHNLKEIAYGKDKSLKITKKELAEEYKVFLRMIKDKNDILKKTVRGNDEDVPKKIKLEEG